jgi:uncharacterized protein Yka (UPF0111/DUF47 family)
MVLMLVLVVLVVLELVWQQDMVLDMVLLLEDMVVLLEVWWEDMVVLLEVWWEDMESVLEHVLHLQLLQHHHMLVAAVDAIECRIDPIQCRLVAVLFAIDCCTALGLRQAA